MKIQSVVVLFIVGFVASLMHCEDAEGQLFRRFRRFQSNNNNSSQQIPARQPSFDASEYPYKKPAEPVTDIPSDKKSADSSKPDSKSTAPKTPAPQYRMVTFYDPRTGRTFQRRVLVTAADTTPTNKIASANANKKMGNDTKIGTAAKIGDVENRSSSVVQSSFDDRGVSLLPMSDDAAAPIKGKVLTMPTIVEPTAPKKVVEYSILVREPEATGKATPTIGTPKPETTTSGEIEYDFPALNAAGEKRKRD